MSKAPTYTTHALGLGMHPPNVRSENTLNAPANTLNVANLIHPTSIPWPVAASRSSGSSTGGMVGAVKGLVDRRGEGPAPSADGSGDAWAAPLCSLVGSVRHVWDTKVRLPLPQCGRSNRTGFRFNSFSPTLLALCEGSAKNLKRT